MHRAREHGADLIGPTAKGRSVQRTDFVPETRRTPSGQQLEGDHPQREHIGGRVPGSSGDSFGRAVRSAHGRAQAHPLECIDHAEARGPSFVRRHENVARVQGAMPYSSSFGKVDRRSQLGDEGQRLFYGCRRVMPHRHVERLCGHVFFRPVGDGAFESGGDGFDDGGMEKADLRGSRELVRKGAGLLGSDVEAEDFDSDEPISRGLVCSKNGPKRADTDLMQHPEGAKGWRRRKPGRVVSGQLRCSCFLAAGARAAVNVRKNVTRFPRGQISIFSPERKRENRDLTPRRGTLGRATCVEPSRWSP